MMLIEGDAAAVERAAAREIELWEAYKNRDVAALERLIDPLALDVGPAGVLTRDEVIAAVGRMTIRSYEIGDLQLRADVSFEIATYRSRVNGTYGEQPFADDDVRATSVWVVDNTAWRLAHRHETPADRR